MRPRDIGLPEKFQGWRPSQEEAIFDAGASGRFAALAMPTGSGKSAVSIGLARLLGGRTAILTSTKGLQDQLAEEFGALIVDIRGKGNYLCDLERPKSVTVNEATCQLGMPCMLKAGGCTFYERYRQATMSPIVVTNYAFWLSSYEYGEGLGAFDNLIIDEAHNAPDELSDFMSVSIAGWEFDAYLSQNRPPDDRDGWHTWAYARKLDLDFKIADLKSEIERSKRRGRGQLQRIKDLVSLRNRVDRLLALDVEGLVYHRDGQYGDSTWTPVAITNYNDKLFRGIGKVVFISATMRPKTLDMLGITGYMFKEYPSTFPVERRPVIWVPTVSVKHNMTDLDKRTWMDRIDQIIGRNLDRKGIIHTVSYSRRDYILRHSRYASKMMTHDRKSTAKTVRQFKAAKQGILVSPSIATGFDFPYDECRYQIITKVPFPDFTNPVVAARSESDQSYGKYLAMVELVQAAGRGMRAPDDSCQTIIVDDNIRWFMNQNRRFAPKWFLEAFTESVVVPNPLA